MSLPTPTTVWLTYAIFAIQVPFWCLSVRNIIRLRRIRGNRNPAEDNHSRAAARASAIDAARAAYAASRDADAQRNSGTRAGEGPRLEKAREGGSVVVPDLIEPIVAFRSWKVLPSGQLHACAQDVGWPLGGPIIAYCTAGGIHKVVPAAPCSCGVYGAKSLHTVPLPHSDVMAWGTVSMWGKVVEYTAGYRAQYAYPKDIVLIFGPSAHYTPRQRELIAQHLHANYDVPVRMGSMSDLMEFIEKKSRA